MWYFYNLRNSHTSNWDYYKRNNNTDYKLVFESRFAINRQYTNKNYFFLNFTLVFKNITVSHIENVLDYEWNCKVKNKFVWFKHFQNFKLQPVAV